jgi:hypothetical protein
VFGPASACRGIEHFGSPLAECADALKSPLGAQFGRDEKSQFPLSETCGPWMDDADEALKGLGVFKLGLEGIGNPVADVLDLLYGGLDLPRGANPRP